MFGTNVRLIEFQGCHGAFIDEQGGMLEYVGDWQLRCSLPVRTYRMLGGHTGRVSGAPSLELVADGERGSERFQGELTLPTGVVHQVTLVLAPTLMHVNQVQPAAAWQAIRQHLG